MEDTSKNNLNNPDTENIEQTETLENTSNNEYINAMKEVLFKNRNNKSEQVKNEYKFWDTQPVPKIKSEDSTEIGPIDLENDLEKERKDPLKLPASFSWYDIDINKDTDLTKVKKLLEKLYHKKNFNLFLVIRIPKRQLR